MKTILLIGICLLVGGCASKKLVIVKDCQALPGDKPEKNLSLCTEL